MGEATSPRNGYSVLIVGAGIGGLAAAAFLAGQCHNVTVLESKPTLNEFGASIGIMPSATRIFRKFGLEEAFSKVITKNNGLEVRDGLSNEKLGFFMQNLGDARRIKYRSDTWNIHRADYQQTLAKCALDNGAEILFDAEVKSVDVGTATLTLVDGRKLTADLIVAADGMRSAIRHSIPGLSHISPIALDEQCFRCSIPKSLVNDHPNPETKSAPHDLLNSGNEYCFTTSGRYVLLWPMLPSRSLDLVACIVRPSPLPPGTWGLRANPKEMAAEFSDFCPAITELLGLIPEGECVQWTLAELPPLPHARSADGRVVLLGDAWHAMVPHAASGGTSAVEDAAVLAVCLTHGWKHGKSAGEAGTWYERLRKPRVERMQAASKDGCGFLSAGGEEKRRRDELLGLMMQVEGRELEERMGRGEGAVDGTVGEGECGSGSDAEVDRGDMWAPFPTPLYLLWLYGFDAVGETAGWLRENVPV